MSQTYFDNPALGRSDLRLIYESPALFESYVTGKLERPGPSNAMTMGTALDCLLMNGKPPAIDHEYLLIPDELLGKNGARSTRAAKDWIAEKEAEGHVCYTSREVEKMKAESDAQMETLVRMEQAIHDTPKAKYLLLDGPNAEYQPELYFRDRHSEYYLKSMPDRVIPGECIIDLKTAADVSERHFTKQAYRLWYDVQALLAVDGWAATRKEQLPFVFVCVQNCEPFDVSIFQLSAEFWQLAEERVDDALEVFERCSESGLWKPSIYNRVVTVVPPRWWKA